ncbi:MAG: 23S rRNA (guanosine(2251)-2'-O)-methyltransferase RlmB [Desulfamplus sp.]|nr:23S rRNA (guanosine(2251)-2'-O)-methyltransferase RlmB [Desulfamplus sp.]
MTYQTEILCGIHSVLEAIKAKRRTFEKIYISKDRTLSRLNEIIDLAGSNKSNSGSNNQLGKTDIVGKIEIEFAAPAYLDKMSNGVKHQGVTAKVSPFPIKKAEDELKNWDNADYINNLSSSENENTADKKISNSSNKEIKKEIKAENRNKFIVVLEGIEDTHNLGAIIRTAVCAGVDHIVIPKDRAVQPSPAVSRVSAGAMEHADIHVVTNTAAYLKNLKKKGFWVAGLDADGDTSLFNADLTNNIALIVGGEHQGIRPLVKKECDFLLSLPLAKVITSKTPSEKILSTSNSKAIITTTEGITSLNASVACGIAMYEVVRQRNSEIVGNNS